MINKFQIGDIVMIEPSVFLFHPKDVVKRIEHLRGIRGIIAATSNSGTHSVFFPEAEPNGEEVYYTFWCNHLREWKI